MKKNPCPNCKTQKGIVLNYWPNSCWVACTSCKAAGPEIFFKHHDSNKKLAELEAVRLWNKNYDDLLI